MSDTATFTDDELRELLAECEIADRVGFHLDATVAARLCRALLEARRRPEVRVRRSAPCEKEYRRTVNVYVNGRLRVKVGYVNGSPYMSWRTFTPADTGGDE